jgi:hypothetical protein
MRTMCGQSGLGENRRDGGNARCEQDDRRNKPGGKEARECCAQGHG